MRAMELAVLVIICEMCIGLIASNDLGFFPKDTSGRMNSTPFYVATQGGEISRYQNESPLGDDAKQLDYLKLGLDWLFASFNMLIMIFKSFFFISYDLNKKFGLDPVFCIFLQGVIYIIYTLGIIQWKAGRGLGMYE